MKKLITVFLIIILNVSIFSFYYKIYAADSAEINLDGFLQEEGEVPDDLKVIGIGKKVAASDALTIDEVISGADGFIEKGETNVSIDENELRDTIDFLYNLLLAFGIIAAVVVGSILGIKYMLGSVEEKAEYKETLMAYFISCVVVFGAFGIWKLVINILSSF